MIKPEKAAATIVIIIDVVITSTRSFEMHSPGSRVLWVVRWSKIQALLNLQL
jgi:hypothetical protein